MLKMAIKAYSYAFLSTPSARRATCRSERPTTYNAISIHALRKEGDFNIPASGFSQSDFYPRPPQGGRRRKFVRHKPDRRISIHALRKEGDTPHSPAFA